MKKTDPTKRLTKAGIDEFHNKTLTWFVLTCRLQGNLNLEGTMFCRMTVERIETGEVAPGIKVKEAIEYLIKVKYITKARTNKKDTYLRWFVTSAGASRATLTEI